MQLFVAWRFALAGLVVGATPAWAQDAADQTTIMVHPSRVPPSSPHVASLPPPPAGPIESRVLSIPDALSGRSSATAGAGTLAVVGFVTPSPNLNDVTRAQLDRLATHIADRGVARIELRAFAPGGDVERRKIALARALVVRAYLIDRGVKSRIEVASFWGEGEHVEILAP
jgi:outer membrane protein OmpA-like peptidoglycan-associated protein